MSITTAEKMGYGVYVTVLLVTPGFFYLLYMLGVWFARLVVSTTHMGRVVYHQATRDWWEAYKSRRVLHNTVWRATGSSAAYALPKNGYDLGRCVSYTHGLLDYHRMLTWCECVSFDDELHVRYAHYSHDGRLANYSVLRGHCVVCVRFLPAMAFYVGDYYVCILCISDTLLPRFCAPRLLLLREMIVYDVALIVARCIALLCVDWHQSMTALRSWPSERHCKCDLYECDNEFEKERMVVLEHSALSLMRALES